MNLSGDFHSFRLFKKGTFSFTEKVPQTVDKTLLVSTPEAFFLFWVQKVCT